jgi:hypothetical protein
VILFALLACASTDEADTSESIYGEWSVSDLRLADTELEDGWSGQVELRETGVGSMVLTEANGELEIILSVEETDADPLLQGWADGTLLILHMSCGVAAGTVDCVASGEIDWSEEDSDTHFTLLSLAN